MFFAENTGGVCSNTIPGGEASNCVYQYTANAGNPDLKPTRSTQFDLSYEWYVNTSTSLTATLFYKDIYNFIANSPQFVQCGRRIIQTNVRVCSFRMRSIANFHVPANRGRGSGCGQRPRCRSIRARVLSDGIMSMKTVSAVHWRAQSSARASPRK